MVWSGMGNSQECVISGMGGDWRDLIMRQMKNVY